MRFLGSSSLVKIAHPDGGLKSVHIKTGHSSFQNQHLLWKPASTQIYDEDDKPVEMKIDLEKEATN